MIARHCHQESEKGEGVEVVKYEPCEDPVHGVGHYTEKRLHLYKCVIKLLEHVELENDFNSFPFLLFNSKLPTWMQSFIPNIFYIEEKSWNYFPITVTGELI